MKPKKRTFLNEKQKAEISQKRQKGTRPETLAKQYNVSKATIYNIGKPSKRKIVFRKESHKNQPAYPLKNSPIIKMLFRNNGQVQGLTILANRIRNLISHTMELERLSKKDAIKHLAAKPSVKISVILTEPPGRKRGRQITLFYDFAKKKSFFKTNFEIEPEKPTPREDLGKFRVVANKTNSSKRRLERLKKKMQEA